MTKVTITLKAEPRSQKRAKDLRKEKRVPGVLYGFDVENQPLECNEQAFHRVFVQAGESTVIDLDLSGSTVPVLIHEVSFDPVTSAYAHVDFFAPDMTKEVTAKIALRITGEAPAVKNLGAILVRNRDTVTVRCLPKDLPHDIPVDISLLENFHDAVLVSALSLPSTVAVLEEGDEIVASVQPPRKEEEGEKAAPAEGEVAEGMAAEGEAVAGDEKAEAAGGGEGKETAKKKPASTKAKPVSSGAERAGREEKK
jgi:large subunit ribosomal protein L25